MIPQHMALSVTLHFVCVCVKKKLCVHSLGYIVGASLRPGNISRFSGILGFSQQIFCESAVIATSEITRFSVKI